MISMDDIHVCSNWEEIADNAAILDQQLEQLRVGKGGNQTQTPRINGGEREPRIRILARNSNKSDKNPSDEAGLREEMGKRMVVLDSTREESLRSQYVPPEPKITLLARPKGGASKGVSNGPSSKSKGQQPVKTLEQREKEYMEARKRILGDVQFTDAEEDREAEAYPGLSPADVLKQKIAQAMGQEVTSSEKSKNKNDDGVVDDTLVNCQTGSTYSWSPSVDKKKT